MKKLSKVYQPVVIDRDGDIVILSSMLYASEELAISYCESLLDNLTSKDGTCVEPNVSNPYVCVSFDNLVFRAVAKITHIVKKIEDGVSLVTLRYGFIAHQICY